MTERIQILIEHIVKQDQGLLVFVGVLSMSGLITCSK